MSKNSITVGKMSDTKNTGNTNQPISQFTKFPEISKISKNNGKLKQNQNNNNSNDNNKINPLSAGIIEKNGDPVNMATGEYIYEDKDYIIPDMGGDYSLIRRYTGPASQKNNSSLGKVWALSTDTNVMEEGNYAIVTMPDGKTAEYTEYNGEYTNKKGGTKKYTLEKTENGYKFTDNTKKLAYYYNKNGKIEKTTDRNLNTTKYIHNEYGIDRLILPTGFTLAFTWENMKVSQITDSAGRTVKYRYENGLLIKVIRCDGTEIKYTYDEKQNLKTVTDAEGCTYLENRYDDERRIIKQSIKDGETFTYTYDEENRTNTITEQENGAVTTYTYDENSEITDIKYPDGSMEKRKTDQCGNITEKTDRCGAVTLYKYDIMGNLLMEKEPSGLITNYEYNNNCLIKKWDNAGRKIKYKYDENGNITEERKLLDEKSGKEYITEYRYDSYGRITEKIENERATLYKYAGTFPEPVQITSPDKTETRLKYDEAGRITEKTTEEISEKYVYTAYNRLKTYTDGEGNVTTYNYDKCWRLINVIKPAQEKGETYGYDSMDRIVSHTDECGRMTRYKRNAYGDIIQVRKCGIKEENSESITYEYDLCHRIIKKQVGKYGCEIYAYDSCGRMTGKSLNDYGKNNVDSVTGYEYKRDSAGRIKEVKDPYGNTTDAYSYDLHGNVKKHIHSTSILKEMSAKGGTAEDDVYPGDIYGYNASGLMTSKKELLSFNESGIPLYCINKYVYDEYENMTMEITYTEPQPDSNNPYGRTRKIQRSYDICGRLTGITDGTGARATYEYDGHGRKIRETAEQDSEKTVITEYKYNRCGKLTKQKILQKTENRESHKPELKRRNGNRFLESVKKEEYTEIKEPTEILMEETAYAYDKSGDMVKSIMPDGLIITYQYDESGRKTSVTASDIKNHEVRRKSTYKYDEYGYMSEKTENGLTAIYENDAFGNILKEKNADGGTAVYKYDFNGKCICRISPEEYRKSGKDSKGTVKIYDLCGRLTKTISPEGITLEENEYDSSGNLLEHKNADGGGIKYGYDAGGRLIYAVTEAGVRTEYAYDALGNITSRSLGDDVSHFENDVWGHILEVKKAEGITETYGYDKMGNIVSATDGEGRRREYHRNI